MSYNKRRGIIPGPLKGCSPTAGPTPRRSPSPPTGRSGSWWNTGQFISPTASPSSTSPLRKEVVTHTYAEFYQQVKYLATYMLKRGIRGRKIALVGENSYQWLLCFFAVVTSGNVAVLVAKDATPAEASTPDLPEPGRRGGHLQKYPYEKELLAQKLLKSKYCFSMRDLEDWAEKGQRFYEKGRGLYERWSWTRTPCVPSSSPRAPVAPARGSCLPPEHALQRQRRRPGLPARGRHPGHPPLHPRLRPEHPVY